MLLKNQILKNKRFRIPVTIVLHFLFWALVWLFYRYFFSYNSDDQAYVIWFSSFLLPLTMAVSYFMVYYLIPSYLLKKDYLHFVLYSFYALVFTSWVIALLLYGFLIFYLDMNIALMPPMSKNFLFILILVLLVVGAVSSINILNQTFRISTSNKELKNKILATQLELKEQELKNLKSQIHPHFLFNTLNTIYGMAIARSEQTPELILRLSNLLDYILYQVSKPRVSLNEELLHIREYVELERIRFKDTLRVSFKLDKVDDKIEIAPMVLIPFVENAFKHGSLKDGFLEVDIVLEFENEQLIFSVKNTAKLSDNGDKAGGIGLGNIRKRLELLYPENYRLDYVNEPDFYKIRLAIFNLKR